MDSSNHKNKPLVYFTKIKFNDGTEIDIDKKSIIVFTGANNSGKSQALKDLENLLNKESSVNQIVVTECGSDYKGDISEENFLLEHFWQNEEGLYISLDSGRAYNMSSLISFWNQHSFNNLLHKAFINRLSTEKRLTTSNALVRSNSPEQHPIFKLNKYEKIAQEISDYFRQAFGVDLVVNRNNMQTIPLHVGNAPDKSQYTIDMQDEYYRQVEKLPLLQEQGDGMRSFASILLDTFASNYSITLIDEPEAFLHPPQARLLGKMLGKANTEGKQLFVSTHSEDFLQGLLDSDNDNVIVVRINRNENINRISILQNEKIKGLWGNPILRYSNILSGLFHDKVIVCESDYDCLFYQAIINSLYEEHEIITDILFTHCGGKSRMKDVVEALRAVNVPVIAITDFDLINASQNFKPLVESFGVDWKSELQSEMKTIYDGMNAKCSEGYDAWKHIKKIGKNGFDGDEPRAYEVVEKKCKQMGLFIVPVGEMESFDKTINKEKKDWVYSVLGQYDLKLEPKLETARCFIREIVEFKRNK